MKCSVIIPYYKRKELLINTLYSLAKQEQMDKRFEVIIIDDGSNDITEENILALGLSINIKYFSYPRSDKSGASFARNRGIEHASGELLIFLDCDILVWPDFVYQHYRFYSMCPDKEAVLQIGLRKKLNQTGITGTAGITRSQYDEDQRVRAFEIFSHNLAAIKTNWHLVYSNNISISGKTVEKYGGFDENFKGWGFEDTEFGYRMCKHSVKIVYNPAIEVFHQYHEFALDDNRLEGWKQNYNYFVSKHPDMPVMLQKVFEEFFDPDLVKKLIIREKIQFDRRDPTWVSLWLNCFQRLEKSVREYSHSGRPSFSTKTTLINPGIGELMDILALKGDSAYTVICDKKKRDLIIFIQTEKSCADVQLFTV